LIADFFSAASGEILLKTAGVKRESKVQVQREHWQQRGLLRAPWTVTDLIWSYLMSSGHPAVLLIPPRRRPGTLNHPMC